MFINFNFCLHKVSIWRYQMILTFSGQHFFFYEPLNSLVKPPPENKWSFRTFMQCGIFLHIFVIIVQILDMDCRPSNSNVIWPHFKCALFAHKNQWNTLPKFPVSVHHYLQRASGIKTGVSLSLSNSYSENYENLQKCEDFYLSRSKF